MLEKNWMAGVVPFSRQQLENKVTNTHVFCTALSSSKTAFQSVF